MVKQTKDARIVCTPNVDESNPNFDFIKTDKGLYVIKKGSFPAKAILIDSGLKLNLMDQRQMEFLKDLGVDSNVVPNKIEKQKIAGIGFDIDRFIEAHSFMAIVRMEWLADKSDTKPSYTEELESKSIKSVIRVM